MRAILKYLRPYRGKLAIIFILMALFSLVSGFSLSMLSPFLNTILGGGGSFIIKNDFLSRINEWVLSFTPLKAIIKLMEIFILIYFFKGVIGYFQEYLSCMVIEGTVKDIRNRLYVHLHSLSLPYFHRTRVGVISSRITNDVSYVREAINTGFIKLSKQLFLACAYFLLALFISWKLLILASLVLPFFTFITQYLGKKLKTRSTIVQEKMADIMSTVGETMSGIKVIKAFGMEKFEIGKFFKNTWNYYKAQIRFERVGYLGPPLTEFINTLGVCLILWFGGREILVAHTLTADRFLVFIAAILSMLAPLKAISRANIFIRHGQAAMERIQAMLKEEPKIADAPDAITMSGFKNSIRFKNVSFSYDHGRPILRDINLTIKKGKVIGLCGTSGVGKSTLVDLLARFYDPTEGEIEIDGINLKKIRLKSLKNMIGIVPQETILFNDTVRANIAYGRDGTNLESIVRAAKAARAQDFIEKLTDGYDTILGERGLNLSGGERQRIAIARALFKNPDILIFDEATSSLDTESEKLVSSAIQELLKGRTCIIIAHRLSTIINADRIVVLDKGKIVEKGTHSQLIRMSGVYRRLYEGQNIRQDGTDRETRRQEEKFSYKI
jgi:subfamily B ATP-binding cassette protein MsbA